MIDENLEGIDFPHNLTEQWIESILQQIYDKQKHSTIDRNEIIEIEHNFLNISPIYTELFLNIVKHQIKHSFSLVSPGWLFLFFLLYGFVFVFGLLSNSLIIYSFYKSKNLRTFRNIFIINLAISDIFLCSICSLLTLFRYIELTWKLGRVLCKIGPGLQTVNVIVSALSITAIAVDRWNFIVHSGKNLKKIFLYICIVLIWLISFLVSIPAFIVTDEKTIQIKQTKEILYKVCEETWYDHKSKIIFCSIILTIQYLLPVIIVGSTNYKICHYLHLNVPKMFRKKSQRPITTTTSTHSKQENSFDLNDFKADNNRKLLFNIGRTSIFLEKFLSDGNEKFSRSKKILFIVFMTFLICWLPVSLCNLFLDFTDHSDLLFLNGSKLAKLILFSNLIAMLSSCLNPVIYGLLNKNFKQEFLKLMKPKQSSNVNSQLLNKETDLNKETNSISNNAIIVKANRLTNSNNTYI